MTSSPGCDNILRNLYICEGFKQKKKNKKKLTYTLQHLLET